MADLEEKLKELNNTADTTAEFEPDDIENNKVMAILAYVSWLVLIPIFGAKESRFARFHVNQGLVLAIAEIVGLFIAGVLDGIPLIGWIFSIAGKLISLACGIIAVVGIVNAAQGKAKELPIVGKYKIFK